ncbi:MAG: hypothetical protein ACE5IW_04090 [bacterium]
MTTNKQLIEKAKSYPFSFPTSSYIFVNGNYNKIVEFGFDLLKDSKIRINGETVSLNDYLKSIPINSLPNFSDLIPVLAYGSNASYEQLKRKFSCFQNTVIIPVIKARLYDFDVVYSSHFSKYASIPAALQYSPGTIVETFVTYLSTSQLAHMHKTESIGVNYCFGQLSNIQLSLDNNFCLSEIKSYFTLHGCLFINGSHISLSAVPAKNRKFPEMNEVEVLGVIKDLLDNKNQDLDSFIFENITSEEIRIHRTELLKRTAKNLSYKYFEILED